MRHGTDPDRNRILVADEDELIGAANRPDSAARVLVADGAGVAQADVGTASADATERAQHRARAEVAADGDEAVVGVDEDRLSHRTTFVRSAGLP